MTYIGWLGSICFAVCGIPQAYKSYKEGHSNGSSIYFLLLWLMGEVMTIIYIIPKMDIPLLFNYSMNLSALVIILRYKLWRRHESSKINS